MLNTEQYKLNAEQALKKLMDGNKRFVNFERQTPILSAEERKKLIHKQSPYAIVITCSDSRVSPEIICDCGLGEIFVIRVAAGALSENMLGSIEYAVLALGVELILMLGHDNCGVMEAILHDQADMSEDIKKLCAHVSRHFTEEQKSTLSSSEGVRYVTEQDVKLLESIPVLKEKIKQGKLQVVGAHYNFHTNEIELL